MGGLAVLGLQERLPGSLIGAFCREELEAAAAAWAQACASHQCSQSRDRARMGSWTLRKDRNPSLAGLSFSFWATQV